MKHKRLPIKEWLTWLLVVPATVLSLVGVLRYLLKLWQSRIPWAPKIQPPDLGDIEGLTDEEAASRRAYDPDEEQQRARKKIIRVILRRNLVSIFNLSLLGLAIATFMLNDLLGALTTLGVLIANIVVNTAQQTFAIYNVDKIASQSRPKVNAIRAGKNKGIHTDEIVIGDVLVIGLGDQILADGHILRAADNLYVDDSGFAEHSTKANKSPGDSLQAGEYCLQGWAVYEIQALPPEELRTTQLNAIPESSADLTPLQKIIDRILRILLVLTAIFVLLLIQHSMRWDVVPPEVQKLYLDGASIIFSIAPSGLFFMIIVAYNMGTFDLLKLGALVRDSRSVESLAQVTTICFGKSGTLTGIDVTMEMLPTPNDEASLGENRVRQILGDFVHNTSTSHALLYEMRKAFEGQHRPISSEAPFLSTYGWSALIFNTLDLQGTYILGRPDLFQIETHIDDEESNQDEDRDQGEEPVVQRTWGRLRGFFKRDEEEPTPGELPTPDQESLSENEPGYASEADKSQQTEQQESTNIFQRMGGRVSSFVRREATTDETISTSDESAVEPTQLVFAYASDEQPLFDATGHPALPENLIPLGILTFREQIRPEAKEAIEIFTEAGVQVKIISQQNASEVIQAARQLGLEENQPGGIKTLSGTEINVLGEAQLRQAVSKATVFAPVSSHQKGKIIELLRQNGDYVTMTGEGLNDIEAMQRANLNIAIQGGTQAAIGFADIMLLKDSLQALPQVLKQGRRIVNGLMDVLKLNLVQVAYIFLLLIAVVVTRSKVFFYDPTQGGLIVFFGVVIPSVALTFWATSGPIAEKRMLSQLLRFIMPVGLTSALISLVVYFTFENLSGDPYYAQLGVTYTLTLTGMLMVLFIKPPSRFWVGDSPLSGDKRFLWLVVVMFFLFSVVLMIPLAQELFNIALLMETAHYLMVAGATLVWVLLNKLIWSLLGMRLDDGRQ
jgi:magnesium-transporting ATPase (P-type)